MKRKIYIDIIKQTLYKSVDISPKLKKLIIKIRNPITKEFIKILNSYSEFKEFNANPMVLISFVLTKMNPIIEQIKKLKNI